MNRLSGSKPLIKIVMARTRTQTKEKAKDRGQPSSPPKSSRRKKTSGRIQKPKSKMKSKVSKGKEKEVLDIRRKESENPVETPEEPVKTPPGKPLEIPEVPEQELTPISDTELRRKLKEHDLTGGNQFWPSVIFGAPEKAGLSKIQRADKLISQWIAIRAEHELSLPEALPHIDEQLKKARDDRAALEDTEENNRVVDEAKRRQVVQERTRVLEEALVDSKFEPERENIHGAIEEYRSGRLGYVRHYTLFWAGKPVDTAETYADFAKDRKERLDRYAQEHGPHWLWYEGPLWSHPDEKPRIRVTQEHEKGMPFEPLTRDDGSMYVGGRGPKLCFRSLLDSGATYPSLFQEDLERLGIDIARYAAQSIISVMTGKGLLTSKVYELFVEVLTEAGLSLSDSFLNPHLPMYIGSPCPVFVTPDVYGAQTDENGISEPVRLSGVLPLIAPYITSVPGRNALLMGETRNDVLGAPKFPPERRWCLVHPQHSVGDISGWDRFDNPLITFSHNNGLVVDKDIHPGLSELRVNVGQPDERVLVRSNVEMKWHDVYPQPPQQGPPQPWQPPQPGQPPQPWLPPSTGGSTQTYSPVWP